MYQTPDGLMEVIVQNVTFIKQTKYDVINQNARIISYAYEKKRKLISLLTNDMDSEPNKITVIYRQRGK